MLSWILVRLSRLLDWAVVVLAVFALVYVCQFMINFLSPKEEEQQEEQDSDR